MNLHFVLVVCFVFLSAGASDLCAYQTSPSASNKTAEPLERRFDSVLVSRGPGKEWTAKPTRTLADLPALSLDASFGRYGGIIDAKHAATGFFHTRKIKNRWWLVDPDGHLFIHKGVTSVRALRTKGAIVSLKEQFGTKKKWAESTSRLFIEHGFNGLGPWCDPKNLPCRDAPLVYTKIWNFMSLYGRQRGGIYQASGHTGYPQGCPFIFDPEFRPFCMKHAQQLSELKDDPWLLGHFTDNELPWRIGMLDDYLQLPANDHGNRAATKWLRSSHQRFENMTPTILF